MEKAILIGLITPDITQEQAYEYLDELSFLAKTAGAKPIRKFTQKLPHPDNKTFLGKGKIEEVIYHGDHTRVRIDLLGNNQFILKIPNSSSNIDIKLGNTINVGWNSKDSRALDSK